MKVLWYWRCKMEVPMLDEDEFTSVWQLSSKGPSLKKRFQPVLEV
ncbi:hypothetical protein [Archangium minus]